MVIQPVIGNPFNKVKLMGKSRQNYHPRPSLVIRRMQQVPYLKLEHSWMISCSGLLDELIIPEMPASSRFLAIFNYNRLNQPRGKHILCPVHIQYILSFSANCWLGYSLTGVKIEQTLHRLGTSKSMLTDSLTKNAILKNLGCFSAYSKQEFVSFNEKAAHYT